MMNFADFWIPYTISQIVFLFLLAITPLGIGSALPATLIGALALARLWRHGAKKSIFHPVGSKKS
jgi:hypothetical protein